MVTSRALIDLLRLHGSSELALGQKFQSGPSATQFLQDYCFNANKKCVLKYGSGKSNTYVCDSVGCPWEVRVTRRVGQDGSHRIAKDSIVNMLNGAWVESFSYIPALLLELRDKNPGTTVRLEVDQHRRFMRGFVAFGADVSSQSWLSPLLGFDGTRSKYPKYNGVILSLAGRDGNGQNVTLATALVNVESAAVPYVSVGHTTFNSDGSDLGIYTGDETDVSLSSEVLVHSYLVGESQDALPAQVKQTARRLLRPSSMRILLSPARAVIFSCKTKLETAGPSVGKSIPNQIMLYEAHSVLHQFKKPFSRDNQKLMIILDIFCDW
uniref:Transposase MuDR plant domain-containing protein n=1 Tax=Globisporangium ultimum (strain ATCC 200006 / CBS 805.95 / DAOM BR144) TaxID=431595 RepID=K3W9V3_GLOUD